MPLLDHFRAPVADQLGCTSLLSGWATRIADDLDGRQLPRTLLALEIVELFEVFEVQIRSESCARELAAVIELVSPNNKECSSSREAFAAKTAAYLQQGVSVVIIDIVTSKRSNLHNDVVELLAAPAVAKMPAEHSIYAASYRPTVRDDKPQIDLWHEPLAVGSPLPTMPLRLTGDLFVPVQFESTYLETCRRRRFV